MIDPTHAVRFTADEPRIAKLTIELDATQRRLAEAIALIRETERGCFGYSAWRLRLLAFLAKASAPATVP